MAAVSLIGLTKRYARGDVVVGPVELGIEEGEMFTLLGPSGCGKSTTLRMVAGFVEPTDGRVQFGDRDVTNLAPNARDIGLVFQNYALFPHMNVGRNVAFGLSVRRIARAETATRVADALHQVQLDGLHNARVDQLSGGQQQRVALARALVIRPHLLLLDEPLSNLDARLREETRGQLRRIHAETGVTSIYVTHDQTEAMAMSDRIAVMNRGTIDQVGTPNEIYERPQTRFVASFIGTNTLIDVSATRRPDGIVVARHDSGISWSMPPTRVSPKVNEAADGAAVLVLRAETVRLAAPTADVLTGVVTGTEYQGSVVRVLVDTAVGKLVADVPGTMRPDIGGAVGVVISPDTAYLTSAT